MSLGSLIQGRNLPSPSGVVDYDPTGVIDVTGASVDYFINTQNTFSRRNLEYNQIDAQEEFFKKTEGRDLVSIIGSDVYNSDNKFSATDEYILEKRKTDPRYLNVKTKSEMKAAAQDEALKSQLNLQRTVKGASPLEGVVGSVVGGLGGSLTDPLTLAAGAAGGLFIKTKNIGKIIAIEAGIGVGTEVAIQPFISGWQKEIGNEYGLGDALTNVAFAGIASAGFAGISSGGLKAGIKGARNKSSAILEMAASSNKTPSSVKATLKEMANYARVKESNIFDEQTPRAMKAHSENVNKIDEALQSGKKLDEIEFDTVSGKVIDDAVQSKPIEAAEKQAPQELEMKADDYRNNPYELDEENAKRIEAQEELDFKTALDNDPDLRVSLDGEVELRISEIEADAKAARSLYDAVKVCSV